MTDGQAAPRAPFIEPKPPDWGRIAELCELSARAERWANFGPVCSRLAETIGGMLDLGADRAVVPASSATAALQAIAGMRAARAGRPLNWVVSAFSFFSPAVGAFAGRIQIVDCDRTGLLDLDQVVRLEPSSFDGVIVTNVFGMTTDVSRFGEFCRARDKRLIIDNALAFPAPRPLGARAADEIISFHHTKPWGFGEGGCAVVSRDDAELVRSFLNFGVGADPAFAGFAANGKLSDLAAAAILDRIERLPSWAPGYGEQRARIARLALGAGLTILGAPPRAAISPHVPVLAPGPTSLAAAPAARFDVGKYYRPLAMGNPVAEELYARMINTPCHPGMQAIGDSELLDFFAALAAGPDDQ